MYTTQIKLMFSYMCGVEGKRLKSYFQTKLKNL